MANVTQLKHLEHLEDEMLNYGVDGCKAAVSFLMELRKMLGCDNSSGFMQTKWDGAPSLVCGKDPKNGLFFVGTKAVFNKDPKLCYSPNQIDTWYGDRPDLATKLKLALEHFKALGIDGILQGDLLFTIGDLKSEMVHGEKLYTFRPNTITYGVPVDHEIGKRAKAAKIGIVFHTHYRGQDTRDDDQPELLENMTARAGIGGVKFTNNPNVFIVDNDTPMDKVGLNHTEERTFDTHVASIESKCKTCGDFLDEQDTRFTHPLNNYRGMNIDRFEHLPIDPQCNIYYNNSINSRLVAKDTYKMVRPEFLVNTPFPVELPSNDNTVCSYKCEKK